MLDTTGMANITEPGDGLSRFFDIRTDAKGDEFTSRSLVTQDYVPYISENAWHKMNGDGWTKDRTMRKVASIPTLSVALAKDQGYDLDDQNELRRWLSDNPQFMTVKQWKGKSHPNIIIK